MADLTLHDMGQVIRRWTAPHAYGWSDGEYVKYADHIAAVKQAERDMLDKCIAAVEAAQPPWPSSYQRDAIAALRDLLEEKP